MRFGAQELAIGTGFLYERHGRLFVVTAWHNVTGRHSESLNCQNRNASVPDNVLVTVRTKIDNKGSDQGSYPISVAVPLVGKDNALFYVHPKGWPRVDVVAIPFDPDSLEMEFYAGDEFHKEPIRSLFPPPGSGDVTFEFCPFQNFSVSDRRLEQEWLETVDVTEELFIPGYPRNIQAQHSRPVWKRATIASSVQQGLDGQPRFLIDSASHKGMSGSPVVFYSPGGTVRVGGTTSFLGVEAAILVGVYVGRIGVTNGIDPQVGTVWHRDVIDQIIDAQCFERLSWDIAASSREREAAIRSLLSGFPKGLVDSISDSKKSMRHVAHRKIMEDLNGRASPSQVLDELIEIASSYTGPYAADEGD